MFFAGCRARNERFGTLGRLGQRRIGQASGAQKLAKHRVNSKKAGTLVTASCDYQIGAISRQF